MQEQQIPGVLQKQDSTPQPQDIFSLHPGLAC